MGRSARKLCGEFAKNAGVYRSFNHNRRPLKNSVCRCSETACCTSSASLLDCGLGLIGSVAHDQTAFVL